MPINGMSTAEQPPATDRALDLMPEIPWRVIELDGIEWSEQDLVDVLRSRGGSKAEAARRRRLREALSSELHRRAWPILKAMIREGRIEALLPWPVLYEPGDQVALQTNESVRDDLVADVLTAAMTHFWSYAIKQKAFQPRREKGSASLLTYFVHGALYAYPEAYRQWSTLRHDRITKQVGKIIDEPTVEVTAEIAAEDRVVLDRGFTEVNALAKPTVRKLLALMRLGYSAAEAGAMLDVSARAVEGHMRRLRSAVATARRRGLLRSPWDTSPTPPGPFRRIDLTAPTRADLRRRGSVVR